MRSPSSMRSSGARFEANGRVGSYSSSLSTGGRGRFLGRGLGRVVAEVVALVAASLSPAEGPAAVDLDGPAVDVDVDAPGVTLEVEAAGVALDVDAPGVAVDVDASGLAGGGPEALPPRPRLLPPRVEAAVPREALGALGLRGAFGAAAFVRCRFFGGGPSSSASTSMTSCSGSCSSASTSSSMFSVSSRTPRSTTTSRKMCSRRIFSQVNYNNCKTKRKYARTLMGALMNARCINSLLNARELRKTSDVPRTMRR